MIDLAYNDRIQDASWINDDATRAIVLILVVVIHESNTRIN